MCKIDKLSQLMLSTKIAYWLQEHVLAYTKLRVVPVNRLSVKNGYRKLNSHTDKDNNEVHY